MTFTKYKISDTRIGILTNTYGHNLAFVLEVCDELKKDYPELTDEDIDLMYLAGERHKRQFAFEATVKQANKDYTDYPADWLKTF